MLEPLLPALQILIYSFCLCSGLFCSLSRTFCCTTLLLSSSNLLREPQLLLQLRKLQRMCFLCPRTGKGRFELLLKLLLQK